MFQMTQKIEGIPLFTKFTRLKDKNEKYKHFIPLMHKVVFEPVTQILPSLTILIFLPRFLIQL